MIDTQYVGANIKKYRKQMKKSQVWLAKHLEVSQRLVSYWESGERQPKTYGLPGIARVLGITVVELIAETENSCNVD